MLYKWLNISFRLIPPLCNVFLNIFSLKGSTLKRLLKRTIESSSKYVAVYSIDLGQILYVINQCSIDLAWCNSVNQEGQKGRVCTIWENFIGSKPPDKLKSLTPKQLLHVFGLVQYLQVKAIALMHMSHNSCLLLCFCLYYLTFWSTGLRVHFLFFYLLSKSPIPFFQGKVFSPYHCYRVALFSSTVSFLIVQCKTVRSRIIGTLDENLQKRLYKINTDNEIYFMLKHMGKRYTFILIQLF